MGNSHWWDMILDRFEFGIDLNSNNRFIVRLLWSTFVATTFNDSKRQSLSVPLMGNDLGSIRVRYRFEFEQSIHSAPSLVDFRSDNFQRWKKRQSFSVPLMGNDVGSTENRKEQEKEQENAVSHWWLGPAPVGSGWPASTSAARRRGGRRVAAATRSAAAESGRATPRKNLKKMAQKKINVTRWHIRKLFLLVHRWLPRKKKYSKYSTFIWLEIWRLD